MHHPTDRIIHTTAFVTPVAGTGNSSMGQVKQSLSRIGARRMTPAYI